MITDSMAKKPDAFSLGFILQEAGSVIFPNIWILKIPISYVGVNLILHEYIFIFSRHFTISMLTSAYNLYHSISCYICYLEFTFLSSVVEYFS